MRDNLLGPEAGGRIARGLVQLEPGLQSVIWLDLASNRIGADGCRTISDCLPKAVALTHLDLTHNELGPGE